MEFKKLKERKNELNYKLDFISAELDRKYNIKIDSSNIGRYLNGSVKKMNPKVLKGICEIMKIDYIPIFKELGFLDSFYLEKQSQETVVFESDIVYKKEDPLLIEIKKLTPEQREFLLSVVKTLNSQNK